MAEEKSIHIFDGDASGAKRAAAEAAAAVRSQAEALEGLASAEQKAASAASEHASKLDLQNQVRARAGKNLGINLGGSPAAEEEAQVQRQISASERLASVQSRVGKNKPIDMLGGQGKAAQETAKGYDQARISAEAFSMLIGRINPELGAMAMVGTRLKDVMAAAFTPAGLMTGGLLAALAAVAAIITTIQETLAQSKQDLADMEAARARMAKGKLESAGEVGKALAESGAGSETALEAATKVVRKSEMEGFDRAAAVKVAAKAEAAGLSLTDDERRRLTQAVQMGAVDLTGRTGSESRASLTSAMGKLGGLGPELQQALNNAVVQTMRGTSVMKMTEAGKGTQDVLEEVLQGMGYEGAGLTRKAADVRSAVEWNRSGRPRGTVSAGAIVPGVNAAIARKETEAEAEARYASGLATLSAIDAKIKSKREQLNQQAEQTANVFVSAVEADYNARQQQARKDRGQDVATTWQETFDPNAGRNAMAQQNRVDRATGMPAPAFDPDRQNKAPVIHITNTGVNYINASDPRMAKRSRMPAK